jgi:hypothetical protein
MSGPIVRKYGFPNFDKIFGERPLQHGVEEEEEQGARTDKAGATKTKRKTAAEPKPKAPKSKKRS